MLIKATLVFLIGINFFVAYFVPSNMPILPIRQEPWRSSWSLFLKEFLNSKIQVPFATEETMEDGRREKDDSEVMKRFGGEVLFEGSFKAITTVEAMNGMTKKIHIDLPKPDAFKDKDDVGWAVHIYPKPESIQSWQSLKPDTKVRFRALVKGISGRSPLINTFVYSILLEEAEIVSK